MVPRTDTQLALTFPFRKVYTWCVFRRMYLISPAPLVRVIALLRGDLLSGVVWCTRFCLPTSSFTLRSKRGQSWRSSGGVGDEGWVG